MADNQTAPSENLEQVNRELQEKATIKIAKELNLPYVNIGKTPLNADYLKIINFDTASANRIIPFFKVGNKLRVAIDDPSRPDTMEIVNGLVAQGIEVNINLASSSGIDDALRVLNQTQVYKKIDIVRSVEEKSIDTYENEIKTLEDLPKQIENLTAEQGLNLLNVAAIRTGASDIHYEPELTSVTVRFRIDGVLNKVFELSRDIFKNLSNQIKYESKMRLNVFSVPQDGRYSFTLNNQIVGVRVSSIPTPYGESFVCRFLYEGKNQLTFEELGFQGFSLNKIISATKLSQGMILATGPTGSGKSTTLYSMLAIMKNPGIKVITLEDPVEYNIEGVTQSQIDEKNGYTFSSGLRTLLRQDPDIIMLGEIRDLDTAQTAAQAALTGHILLSTLHTNSAIESIPRLINMGLPPFMVAPSLNTILAQRLVRKICPECGVMETISLSERKEFENVMKNLENVNKNAVITIPDKIFKARGCAKCSNTGYSGRMVLTEVVSMSSEMKSLVLENASSIKLIMAARKEGMITMREDGFLKVAQGYTTLEEVYRVTNVSR